MAREMGHGAGHDMQEMVRDMRDPSQPEVVDLVMAPGAAEADLLAAAAAVEAGSDHPLAQAILHRAADVKEGKASAFENVDGKSAKAEVDGRAVLLGNKLLMTDNGIDLGELAARSEELRGAGRTVVHLASAGKLLGLIAIADALRPKAIEAIKALRAARRQGEQGCRRARGVS